MRSWSTGRLPLQSLAATAGSRPHLSGGREFPNLAFAPDNVAPTTVPAAASPPLSVTAPKRSWSTLSAFLLPTPPARPGETPECSSSPALALGTWEPRCGTTPAPEVLAFHPRSRKPAPLLPEPPSTFSGKCPVAVSSPPPLTASSPLSQAGAMLYVSAPSCSGPRLGAFCKAQILHLGFPHS